MFVVLRVLLTVAAAIIGVVAGGLLGFFGVYYFCVVFDWWENAGPGNSIAGGMWIVCFLTVPGGAFGVGALAATCTWMKLQPRAERSGANDVPTPSIPDRELR